MSAASAPIAQRSSFVTAVAWIFIALAAMFLLISLLQNAMVHLLFPMDEMRAQLAREGQAMPSGVRWMLEHIAWLFAGFALVSAWALAVSIGLLKRRNWARIGFIALMLFGILYQFAGLALQWSMLADMGLVGANAPPQFAQRFEAMRNLMLGFGVLMGVAFGGLFGWLAWKFMQPAVVAEFRPRKPPGA